MIAAWLTDTVTADLDRAMKYTLLWGLEGVELRSVGHAGDIVPFVNEEKLRRRLEESELACVSLRPGLFEGAVSDRVLWMNELAAMDECFQFARRIGCNMVAVEGFAAAPGYSLASAAEVVVRAAEKADRYGIRLAVGNGVDRGICTAEQLAELLDRVNHPSVGAAWDPAAAFTEGEAPGKGRALLADRIELVRALDLQESGTLYVYGPFGEGVLKWGDLLADLSNSGFDGPLVLEVHRDPRPKTGLADATSLIRHLRAARNRK